MYPFIFIFYFRLQTTIVSPIISTVTDFQIEESYLSQLQISPYLWNYKFLNPMEIMLWIGYSRKYSFKYSNNFIQLLSKWFNKISSCVARQCLPYGVIILCRQYTKLKLEFPSRINAIECIGLYCASNTDWFYIRCSCENMLFKSWLCSIEKL